MKLITPPARAAMMCLGEIVAESCLRIMAK